MSIMVSAKNTADGHKYRHCLVNAILDSNLPIDIWGNGTCYYKDRNDPRVKTDFPLSEIYKMYEPYKFHIAIENYSTPHYFTEKILNCFLCKTVPIYYGCTNILKYVNKDHVICLSNSRDISIRVKKDMELLEEIVRNPDKYYNPMCFNSENFKDLTDIFGFIDRHF
jgi:hypothetical protein